MKSRPLVAAAISQDPGCLRYAPPKLHLDLQLLKYALSCCTPEDEEERKLKKAFIYAQRQVVIQIVMKRLGEVADVGSLEELEEALDVCAELEISGFELDYAKDRRRAYRVPQRAAAGRAQLLAKRRYYAEFGGTGTGLYRSVHLQMSA